MKIGEREKKNKIEKSIIIFIFFYNKRYETTNFFFNIIFMSFKHTFRKDKKRTQFQFKKKSSIHNSFLKKKEKPKILQCL
jgi:hypothetical protein